MDEAEITQALQADLNFFKVKVQVKHRDEQLHILISRSQTNDVDYTVLFDSIHHALIEKKLPVEVFTVYGRLFGSKHPEWQRQGELPKSAITEELAIDRELEFALQNDNLEEYVDIEAPELASQLTSNLTESEIPDLNLDDRSIAASDAASEFEMPELDAETVTASETASDFELPDDDLWSVDVNPASDFEMPELDDAEAATTPDFELPDDDWGVGAAPAASFDMPELEAEAATASDFNLPDDDLWNVDTNTPSDVEMPDLMNEELERSLGDDLEMPDLGNDDTSASVSSDRDNFDLPEYDTPDLSMSEDFGMPEYNSQEPSVTPDIADEADEEPVARAGGKKYVGAIALAGLLAVAGGGWFIFDKSAQEQKLAEAQAVAAKTLDPNQLGKVEALQDAQAQLKKAVTLLAEIPNRPGSPYEQAQAKLKELQPKLQAIDAKINLERPAIDKLESAKKLAMEASIIVQNPPHKAEVWQTAQGKWQEALKLLEGIPQDSLAAAEVKQKLELYRGNFTTIAAQAQKQKQIDFAASLWPKDVGPDLQTAIQQLKAQGLAQPQFINNCVEIVRPRLNVAELKQQGFQPDAFSKNFCEYVVTVN
jgi:hypothetical protein